MIALIGLCRGSEEGTVGDLLALLEAILELDAVNGTGALVLCPSAAGDVSANDCLDGQHLCALYEHGAALDLVLYGVQALFEFCGEVVIIGGDDVGLDEGGCEQTEPEGGEGVQELALVGDAILEDDVEGRDAVGGYKEDGACMGALGDACVVDIADLALCDEGERKLRCDDGRLRHGKDVGRRCVGMERQAAFNGQAADHQSVTLRIQRPESRVIPGIFWSPQQQPFWLDGEFLASSTDTTI
ncbi:hypothetical protein L1887_48174 [Cichorium endivia]|nr:hypothetical protein L1887_48174 [Cichorium endivia]